MKNIVLFVMVLCSFTNGNICGIGSEGGHVFIEPVDDINMTKEVVTVNTAKDSAIVQCQFRFFNNGNKTTRIVGFLNSRGGRKTSPTPVKDFRTWINSKEVNVYKKIQPIIEEVTDADPGEDKVWFVWYTTFASKDTTVIENHYTTYYSRCKETGQSSIYYMLGTGETWDGPIENGTISFNFGDFSSPVWIKKPYVSASGITMKIAESKIEFSFTHYTPKKNDCLQIDFSLPGDTASHHGTDTIFNGFLK